MQPATEPASLTMKRLVDGYRISQAIRVAVTLGLADHLRDGPRGADDLAAATETHPPALYRLLRALASVGVFREEGDRRFALTPLGDCLRADAPEPVGPWATFAAGPYLWRAWEELLQSVRTGESAVPHVHGMSAWEYRARHPEEGAIFDAAMTGNSRRLAAALLAGYDFRRFGRGVDVGGGQGLFLAAILARYPTAQGVLFDQPHVVAGAGLILHAAGVADRCRVVGGSFFEAVPDGGDAYVLKFVLHDWADEEATAILRACRRAIGPGGALLVVERVVGPPNDDADAKFSDLLMLVGPGGRERTRAEWDALFAAAGFRLAAVTPTASEVSVIEGAPA
ncbi:MAG TPA: methyltransferase [Thermomicrobiales bacterium]|nr:methyltransferase [Thermomicrobiales bacterium]